MARYQVGQTILPIISIGRTASTIFYYSFFITTKHHISVQESKNVYACISELIQKYEGSVIVTTKFPVLLKGAWIKKKIVL